MYFRAPAVPDGSNKPLWPFVLIWAGVLSALTYVSLKGQAEIHARVERERRARGLPEEKWGL